METTKRGDNPMTEKKDKAALSCSVCLKEVDQSESETYEVEDYVHHFCGLECYSKWQHSRDSGKDATGKK